MGGKKSEEKDQEEVAKLSEENRKLREQLRETVTSYGRGEKQTIDVGVQASDIEDDIRAENIRRGVELGGGAAKDAIKEEWPAAAFKVTEWDESDPLKSGADLAFCDLLKGEQDVVVEGIIDRYTELEGSGMESAYEVLKETHKVKRGGAECAKERRVYKINLNSGEHT